MGFSARMGLLLAAAAILCSCVFDRSGIPVADDQGEAIVDIGNVSTDLDHLDAVLVETSPVDSNAVDSDATLPSQTFPPANIPPGTVLPAPCAKLIPPASGGSIDTGACETVGLPSACAGIAVPQGTGPDLCVIRAAGLSVAQGATLEVDGDKPLVLVLEGDSEIDGIVDAGGEGTTPGPGGGAGGQWVLTAKGYEPTGGSGPGGGGTCACDAPDKDDCAGGGGGYGTAGADGGLEDEGNGGCSPPPQGGAPYGDKSLTPLQGGSGGASGRNTDGSNGKPGIGGGGGGAIQISVQGTLTVQGAINVGGGGGGHANDDQQQWAGGAGGGGSGGAALLEAIQIIGTGWVAANGGGGGGGGTHNSKGQDGEPGQSTNTPAKGGAGAKDGETGGTGAAGQTPPKVGGSGYDSPGGGGGGLGRIRLNWCTSCPGVGAPTLKTSGVSSTGLVIPGA